MILLSCVLTASASLRVSAASSFPPSSQPIHVEDLVRCLRSAFAAQKAARATEDTEAAPSAIATITEVMTATATTDSKGEEHTQASTGTDTDATNTHT